MKAFFSRHPLLLYLGAFIFAAYVLLDVLTRPGSPVEVLSGTASSAVVVAGEDMQVKFIVNRNEICPNTISSFWEDSDGDPTPIRLPMRSRTIPQIGKHLTVIVPLSAPMQLGRMCYRSHVVHRCPGGEATVVSPPVCVMVVAK